jgi:MoaA/NifB/PqqE/SkfB family radical SAM enzyme
MYCPSDLHDSTSTPVKLDDLKTAWKNIHSKTTAQNLPYKISFTGGEVTANRNFLSFVTWLRATYPEVAMISVTTNGSASLPYYLKLAKVVESISFSTHSEFMDEASFFKKAIAVNDVMINPAKSFHVNVMDEFWNQDKTSQYTAFLTQKNISHTVNSIDYQHQTRPVPVFKGKYNLHELVANAL